MSHNYLVEIGLEDMPANVIDASIAQFKDKTVKFLNDNKIKFNSIHEFSTPRRLALLIEDIAEKQDDLLIESRGPALKIAKNEDGSWSKPTLGFAKKNQVSPDELSVITLKNKEYLYLKKEVPGKNTVEILPQIKDIITSLTFKTRMRWANHKFEYIRPIHWFVSLFDKDVVPFSVLNIKADRKTFGHRFLGKEVELNDALDYEDALRNQHVIADQNMRKELILNQIDELSVDKQFDVQIDEELLAEVVNIVEYPTAFSGSFDKKYLEVPDAVLITSMKDNQRYFYVTDGNDQLLPYFVAVRNGNSDYLSNVIKGNEKVLTARLEDALFFYREDQKHSVAEYVERLKHVSFHDKLGTIYEKMERTKGIASLLADKLRLSESDKNDLLKAASIYDFDLVTQMVDEFSELQGVMGEIYADLEGYSHNVSSAIFEHYLPVSANGDLPETKVGSLLAIADKLDSILSFFSIGLIPNGSNDPYALRRGAIGIVRILSEKNWSLSLSDLLDDLIEDNTCLFNAKDLQKHRLELDNFIKDRIDQQLIDLKVAPDIIATIHQAKNIDPAKLKEASLILQKARSNDNFTETVQNLSRVQRLFKNDQEFVLNNEIDPALFENESERSLYKAVEEINNKWQSNKDLNVLFNLLSDIVPIISNYFVETMINVDNQSIKDNRLSQMARLAILIDNFGNLAQIVL